MLPHNLFLFNKTFHLQVHLHGQNQVEVNKNMQL